MRAALLVAALALCACGKSKKPEKQAARGVVCDAAAVATVKQQLAAVPAADSELPRVLGSDGTDRAEGAVRLTFFVEPKGDVQVRVGDGPPWNAGELGSSKKLVELLQGARIVELETFAGLSPIALQGMLAELDPAIEVRLLVQRVKAPPADGVARWATEMYAGLGKLASEARAGELQKGLVRALRGSCFTTLDKMLSTAQGKGEAALDEATLRNALPEALATCDCKGTDVTTAAWIYQLLLLRTYEPAWLRLRLDTGGARLTPAATMQDVARGLAALTPAQRQAGVWIVL